MNNQKAFATPTFAPHSAQSNHELYIPPIKPRVSQTRSNEPLPSHIFGNILIGQLLLKLHSNKHIRQHINCMIVL